MAQSEIIDIALDAIEVGLRLRPVSGPHVSLLAASLQASGQHTPIQVGPMGPGGRHILIAGAHRVAAAREAGLTTLQAIVFEGSEDERKLLEIDENFMRHELTALDRSVFMATRKLIFERLHPETKRGGDRKSGRSDQTELGFSLIPGQSFAAATAARLRISDRQVWKYLKRATLPALVRDMLAPSIWADNGAVLDGLVKLDREMQHKVVLALTRAEKPARSLAAAKAEAEGRQAGPPRSADDLKLEQLLAVWERAPARARTGFLAFLVDDDGVAERLEELLADRGPDRLTAAVAKEHRQ